LGWSDSLVVATEVVVTVTVNVVVEKVFGSSLPVNNDHVMQAVNLILEEIFRHASGRRVFANVGICEAV
jgi:hypothetical protein